MVTDWNLERETEVSYYICFFGALGSDSFGLLMHRGIRRGKKYQSVRFWINACVIGKMK